MPDETLSEDQLVSKLVASWDSITTKQGGRLLQLRRYGKSLSLGSLPTATLCKHFLQEANAEAKGTCIPECEAWSAWKSSSLECGLCGPGSYSPAAGFRSASHAAAALTPTALVRSHASHAWLDSSSHYRGKPNAGHVQQSGTNLSKGLRCVFHVSQGKFRNLAPASAQRVLWEPSRMSRDKGQCTARPSCDREFSIERE